MFLTEVEKLRMFRHMISQLRSNFGCTGSHPFWIMTPRSVPLFPDRLSLIAPREFLVLIMDSATLLPANNKGATSLSLLQSSSSGTRGPVGPPTFLRAAPQNPAASVDVVVVVIPLDFEFLRGKCGKYGGAWLKWSSVINGRLRMKVDRSKQTGSGFVLVLAIILLPFPFPLAHPFFTVPLDISSILLLQFAGRSRALWMKTLFRFPWCDF